MGHSGPTQSSLCLTNWGILPSLLHQCKTVSPAKDLKTFEGFPVWWQELRWLKEQQQTSTVSKLVPSQNDMNRFGLPTHYQQRRWPLLAKIKKFTLHEPYDRLTDCRKAQKEKIHIFPLSIYCIEKKVFLFCFFHFWRSVSFLKYHLHKDELISSSQALIFRQWWGQGFSGEEWIQFLSIGKELFHFNDCFAGKLTGSEVEALESRTEVVEEEIQRVSFPNA